MNYILPVSFIGCSAPILGGEIFKSDTGLFITFPKSWEGKWEAHDTFSGITVFNQTILEKYGLVMGDNVFFITITPKDKAN